MNEVMIMIHRNNTSARILENTTVEIRSLKIKSNNKGEIYNDYHYIHQYEKKDNSGKSITKL